MSRLAHFLVVTPLASTQLLYPAEVSKRKRVLPSGLRNTANRCKACVNGRKRRVRAVSGAARTSKPPATRPKHDQRAAIPPPPPAATHAACRLLNSVRQRALAVVVQLARGGSPVEGQPLVFRDLTVVRPGLVKLFDKGHPACMAAWQCSGSTLCPVCASRHGLQQGTVLAVHMPFAPTCQVAFARSQAF